MLLLKHARHPFLKLFALELPWLKHLSLNICLAHSCPYFKPLLLLPQQVHLINRFNPATCVCSTTPQPLTLLYSLSSINILCHFLIFLFFLPISFSAEMQSPHGQETLSALFSNVSQVPCVAHRCSINICWMSKIFLFLPKHSLLHQLLPA